MNHLRVPSRVHVFTLKAREMVQKWSAFCPLDDAGFGRYDYTYTLLNKIFRDCMSCKILSNVPKRSYPQVKSLIYKR